MWWYILVGINKKRQINIKGAVLEILQEKRPADKKAWNFTDGRAEWLSDQCRIQNKKVVSFHKILIVQKWRNLSIS